MNQFYQNSDPVAPKSDQDTVLKLRVGAAVAATLRLLRAEWQNLLLLALLPMVLFAIIQTVFPNEGVKGIQQQPMVAIGSRLLLAFIQAWVAVGGMRYLILGVGGGQWVPPYSNTLWTYILKVFQIAMAMILPIIIFAALVVVLKGSQFVASHESSEDAVSLIKNNGWILLGAIGVILITTFFIGRFTLAMPAAAVGGDSRLITAWRRSRNQLLRMMTFKFLMQLTLLIPAMAIYVLFLLLKTINVAVANFILFGLMGMLQYAVLVAADAILYGHFYQGMVINSSSQNESESHGN